MTPVFARAAADDLARRLDGRAAPASATDPLALVAALRTAGATLDGAVRPRAQFRSALRTRLVAVATVQAVQAASVPAEPVNARHAAVSWRRASRASRAPAVAAGALASVVAVAGVAVAGSQSLPGEPFYGVKTATESLQLRLAGDDVETGQRHLELAATRLREVRALVLGRDAARDPAALPAALPVVLASGERTLDGAPAGPPMTAAGARAVRETLAAMDEQIRAGTALLTGAYRSDRADEPLRALERFAARQGASLADLLPAMPASIQDEGRASLALVTGVGAQAEELLGIGTCTVACDPTSVAPQAPGTTGSSTGGATDCRCPEPAPAPSPEPTTTTAPTTPRSSAPPRTAEPTRSASPEPTGPASPSPSSSADPLPVPLPSLPVPLPVPSGSLPAVVDELGETVQETVDGVEDVLDGVLDPLLPSSLRTAP